MAVYVVVPSQQGYGFVVGFAAVVQDKHLVVPVVVETVD